MSGKKPSKKENKKPKKMVNIDEMREQESKKKRETLDMITAMENLEINKSPFDAMFDMITIM